MSDSTIPLERAWNSWDSEHPAEMSHPPLGLSLRPCAYAVSVNRFTDFPAGAGLRLGPRAIDGDDVELDLAHAGTELTLAYDKPDPDTLRGRWRTRRTGEWGLRFWMILCLRLAPNGVPVDWRFDPASGALTARVGGIEIVVIGDRPPLLATFHESLKELQDEFETKGYFYLESRREIGRVAALRYNLDEMPDFRFAAALGRDGAPAAARAAAALATAPRPGAARPAQSGPFAGALDAVRDVVGWNTVWDPVNRRPYMTASRNWVAQKFGGFGVWLDDAFYHALMSGLFDLQLARENLRAVLAGATPEGNLPGLATGRDIWVDRSQPPIGAFIVWMLYLRSGARDLLDLAYGPLLRNHDWWWRTRDGNGNGLLEYGTSPVGTGLYRGTKLAAKNESSMDNSPVHDEAVLDRSAWTLDCEDVGLNSLLALDGEMLGLIARALGETATAERVEARAEALKGRIAAGLWDERRGVFANRLWSGAFVRSLAPTSFFPLLAGAADDSQAAALLALLEDPTRFGGDDRLPSVSRDDPAFGDNVYWRGRVWPPLNFLVYHGLRRCGFDAAARKLADDGYDLFMGEWAEHRRCPENFNAMTGAACDQPDTDTFYGWGALLPFLGVAEVIDVNPWNGWEITHGAGRAHVGSLLTPAGRAVVEVEDGRLTLSVEGRPALRTNLPGRFRQLRLLPNLIGLVLPTVDGAARWLEFPRVPPGRVRLARLGSRSIEPVPGGDGARFALPAGDGPMPFVLELTGAT